MTRTGIARGWAMVVVLATAVSVLSAPMATATSLSFQPFAAKGRPASGTATQSTATSAAATAVAADFGSIFTAQAPALENSGWTSCSAPIAWSVDAHELSQPQAAAQLENLAWAFDTWGKASGLTFVYAGQESLTYSDEKFGLAPADGTAVAGRHIYLAFVTRADAPRMSSETVGLATPTQVVMSTKQITTGVAVFRADYVSGARDREARSLYLHEFGHVLGLAHASQGSNVMYPVVKEQVTLGAGDINGVQAMVRPCPAA